MIGNVRSKLIERPLQGWIILLLGVLVPILAILFPSWERCI